VRSNLIAAVAAVATLAAPASARADVTVYDAIPGEYSVTVTICRAGVPQGPACSSATGPAVTAPLSATVIPVTKERPRE